MLPKIGDYDALRRAFRWRIPPRYNIGTDICDKWARKDPDRAAIVDANSERVEVTTFAGLRDQSNRLAVSLRSRGVARGDRIAILLPQMAEVAIAHAATYKLGAVALPLASVFGVEGLEYRLVDAGARVVITDAVGLAKINQIRDRAPALEIVISTDGPDRGASGFRDLVSQGSVSFAPVDTASDDPAMMIYTSGTTGPPKGALHAHRVLLGHLPGVQFPHEFLPQPNDLSWTPADWAWAGGLLNILLPSLHFGVPVVARRSEKFDPEAAFGLMERLQTRTVFIPPTGLRMMRTIARPRDRFALRLRTLTSGGELLGAELYDWGRQELGLAINEFYGQTECNLVLASCAAIGVTRRGAIGKPVPGHRVAIIRPDGSVCDIEEPGQIAIRRPDPVMFLEYWNKPEATSAKFVRDWMTTGDQGLRDADGYVRFLGRDDDVITSSGYRIGPGEIEDCLLRHPAVVLAAAVGKPDRIRTEIVKAFVVLRSGFFPSQELAAEIQDFVRTRLSAHEYPREVEFVDDLPMTTTGKVIRRALRDQP